MDSIWLRFSVETMVTSGHGRKVRRKSQGENPTGADFARTETTPPAVAPSRSSATEHARRLLGEEACIGLFHAFAQGDLRLPTQAGET